MPNNFLLGSDPFVKSMTGAGLEAFDEFDDDDERFLVAGRGRVGRVCLLKVNPPALNVAGVAAVVFVEGGLDFLDGGSCFGAAVRLVRFFMAAASCRCRSKTSFSFLLGIVMNQ